MGTHPVDVQRGAGFGGSGHRSGTLRYAPPVRHSAPSPRLASGTLALLAFACAVGCSVGCSEKGSAAMADEEWPEPLDAEGLVVELHARDGWGWERFTVRKDGTASYAIHRERMPELATDRTVSPEELERLRDLLVERECCALESAAPASLAYGGSEGRMRLRLPGASCDVHTPLANWDEEPAVDCDHAIRQLHGRLRPHALSGETDAQADDDADEGSAAEPATSDEPGDEQNADQPVGDVPPG